MICCWNNQNNRVEHERFLNHKKWIQLSSFRFAWFFYQMTWIKFIIETFLDRKIKDSRNIKISSSKSKKFSIFWFFVVVETTKKVTTKNVDDVIDCTIITRSDATKIEIIHDVVIDVLTLRTSKYIVVFTISTFFNLMIICDLNRRLDELVDSTKATYSLCEHSTSRCRQMQFSQTLWTTSRKMMHWKKRFDFKVETLTRFDRFFVIEFKTFRQLDFKLYEKIVFERKAFAILDNAWDWK